MNIWRIQSKPRPQKPGLDPARFCLKNSEIGVGWSLTDHPSTLPGAQAFYSLVEAKFGKVPLPIKYIVDGMQPGDLVWFRVSGIYYLARVIGNWRYEMGQDYHDHDIVNVRKVEMYPVGPGAAVPWGIVKLFFRGAAIRRINDTNLAAFSQHVYHRLSGTSLYEPAPLTGSIFKYLSASDCEDVVAFFIQDRDFQLVPSTCHRDTQQFEFDFVHRVDGRLAAAQVKNGAVDLEVGKFQHYPGEVFLFTTWGKYIPSNEATGFTGNKVHCLAPADVETYVKQNISRMPPKIRDWLDILD
jgi:hypothetical protein